MRCIEIVLRIPNMTALTRLTLTWDVLKLVIFTYIDTDSIRLTLTWDVLK